MDFKPPIYLDHFSTTPMDERVLQFMMPYLTTHFGNPSSKHYFGLVTQAAITKARKSLAKALNTSTSEITFTSGATESINLIIRGVLAAKPLAKSKIVTTKTEHPAIQSTYLLLESQGISIEFLNVDENGLIDLEHAQKVLHNDVDLLSLMHVNNETGVIQDVESLAKICNAQNIPFLCDGSQAFGKIPVDLKKLNLDYYVVNGHKAYGPKGVSGLYIKNTSRDAIIPQITGGGQEFGMRSGTNNVSAIAGFGHAAELVIELLDEEMERLNNYKMLFLRRLKEIFPSFELNGSLSHQIPGGFNLFMPGIPSDILINKVADDIAISSTSACNVFQNKESNVLLEMTTQKERTKCSFRICFGRHTSKEEVEQSALKIGETANYIIDVLV